MSSHTETCRRRVRRLSTKTVEDMQHAQASSNRRPLAPPIAAQQCSVNKRDKDIDGSARCIVDGGLGGATGSASDSRSEGRGFDSH